MTSHTYTHTDKSGMRWRFEGQRPISELADAVMETLGEHGLKPPDALAPIAEHWSFYERTTLSPDASAQRRTDRRKGFYAGFLNCITFMTACSKLPEADGIAHLRQLQADIGKHYMGDLMEPPAQPPSEAELKEAMAPFYVPPPPETGAPS